MFQIREHQIARPVTPAATGMVENLGLDDPELAAVYRNPQPAGAGVFMRSVIMVAAAAVVVVAFFIQTHVPVEMMMLVGP
jgi:hypothetical protein